MKKYIAIIIVVVLAVSIAFSGCKATSSNEEAIEDIAAETTVLEEKEVPDEGTVDENGEDQEAVEESVPEGEYFTGAILKSIDIENNKIIVEQLINDPDEKIIEPEVRLSEDYKVVKSILDIESGEEKSTDTTLEDVPLGSEIGILFNKNDTAKLIIYQVLEEQDDKEKLEEIFFAFFDAVKAGEEYKYFSSATRNKVGTEEEYKNGDKSDIYFIIQESHSNWENIEIQDINIDNNKATVIFTGEREVEGIKSEGLEISFDFVKEDGEWKIDFS